ncbi:hypothetical protein [uncultured Methanobrevibacter sp.]|uniref:hypothetical protein n=1 Tax=uncultured Methanobrevibacter sp. TaxID=253161 RepID=UPI00262F24F4|nr:hypothetical protein [uncultured Methanobrevibacter sp.]
MKQLLQRFPYFLSRDKESNFYRSENVFNEWFKETYNDLFKTYISQHLNKPVLIWKEQDNTLKYTMCFKVNLKYLKQIQIYKNNTLYETHDFEETENETLFNHKITDIPIAEDIIIPTDTWSIYVTTYDEYTLEKGFPENDEIKNNQYDHDRSLDKIGEFLGVPRRTYNYADFKILEYPLTDPPFNNKLTEDDYHYMNRLIGYSVGLHKTPLPCLEIWRLFSVNATIHNREKQLCKMIEAKKHFQVDNDDNIIIDTFTGEPARNPSFELMPWEHEDLMCATKTNLDIFLIASVNNTVPVLGQNLIFTFKIINGFGQDITDNFVIAPFLNNDFYGETLITDKTWIINSSLLKDYTDIEFLFKLYHSTVKTVEALKIEALDEINVHDNKLYVDEESIISNPINITIRGCNTADYYVSSDGDDNNDGKTKNTPFKTIYKAFNSVEGEENLIVLMDGEYDLNEPLMSQNNITVINCGDGAVLANNNRTFIKIAPQTTLCLVNITLKRKCCRLIYKNNTIYNMNSKIYDTIDVTKRINCKQETELTIDYPTTLNTITPFIVTGKLTTTTNTIVANKKIVLSIDNMTSFETNTDEKGEFKFELGEQNIGTYPFVVTCPEDDNYCNSEKTGETIVSKATPVLTLTKNKTTAKIGETVTYTGSLKADDKPVANAQLIRRVSSVEVELYAKTDSNGEFTFTKTYNKTGSTTITVTFEENSKYNAVSVSDTILIKEVTPHSITLSTDKLIQQEGETIIFKAVSDLGGDVYIRLYSEGGLLGAAGITDDKGIAYLYYICRGKGDISVYAKADVDGETITSNTLNIEDCLFLLTPDTEFEEPSSGNLPERLWDSDTKVTIQGGDKPLRSVTSFTSAGWICEFDYIVTGQNGGRLGLIASTGEYICVKREYTDSTIDSFNFKDTQHRTNIGAEGQYHMQITYYDGVLRVFVNNEGPLIEEFAQWGANPMSFYYNLWGIDKPTWEIDTFKVKPYTED